ncbi:hypothetical protein GGF50DRAFT_100064 [Schizophyllum commune]
MGPLRQPHARESQSRVAVAKLAVRFMHRRPFPRRAGGGIGASLHDGQGVLKGLLLRAIARASMDAILIYDHILTFGSEVKYIWPTWRTFSSIVFLFNRYFAFVANVVITAMQDVPHDRFVCLLALSCSIYSTFHSTVIVINQIGVCILLTMRVYALYSRSKKVLTFMLAIAAGLLGLASWAVSDQITWQAPLIPSCHRLATKGSMIRLAAAWEGLFAYDCTMLVLTVYQSYRGRSLSRRVPEPLLRVIVRDGAFYFVVMGLCNLGNIMTFYEYLQGCLAGFSSCVSLSVLSHLIFHLHETGRRRARLPTTGTQRSSILAITHDSNVVFTSHVTAESIGMDTVEWD